MGMRCIKRLCNQVYLCIWLHVKATVRCRAGLHAGELRDRDAEHGHALHREPVQPGGLTHRPDTHRCVSPLYQQLRHLHHCDLQPLDQ